MEIGCQRVRKWEKKGLGTTVRAVLQPTLLPKSPYNPAHKKHKGYKNPVPNTTGRLNKRARMSEYGHSSGDCSGWPVSRQGPADATVQNILIQPSYIHLIARSQQTVQQATVWATEKSLFDSRKGQDIRLYSKCPDRVRKGQSSWVGGGGS
jgi:hypothetical protein